LRVLTRRRPKVLTGKFRRPLPFRGPLRSRICRENGNHARPIDQTALTNDHRKSKRFPLHPRPCGGRTASTRQVVRLDRRPPKRTGDRRMWYTPTTLRSPPEPRWTWPPHRAGSVTGPTERPQNPLPTPPPPTSFNQFPPADTCRPLTFLPPSPHSPSYISSRFPATSIFFLHAAVCSIVWSQNYAGLTVNWWIHRAASTSCSPGRLRPSSRVTTADPRPPVTARSPNGRPDPAGPAATGVRVRQTSKKNDKKTDRIDRKTSNQRRHCRCPGHELALVLESPDPGSRCDSTWGASIHATAGNNAFKHPKSISLVNESRSIRVPVPRRPAFLTRRPAVHPGVRKVCKRRVSQEWCRDGSGQSDCGSTNTDGRTIVPSWVRRYHFPSARRASKNSHCTPGLPTKPIRNSNAHRPRQP